MEGLVRTGKNQFLATLAVLCFIGVSLPALESFGMGFPWTAGAADLTKRLTLLVFASVVGTFLMELLLGSVGFRLTEFLCERLRRSRIAEALASHGAGLGDILREERLLTLETTNKTRLEKFYIVARHLAQERFKDFPELSPLRDFDSVRLYSLYSVVFVVSTVIGVFNLGVSLFHGGSPRDGVVFATIGSLIFALLLLTAARSRYVEGHSATTLSLREKVEEARRRSEETERTQAQVSTERVRQAELESENKRLQGLEVERTLREIHQEILSPKPAERNVGLSRLESSYLRNIEYFDSHGPWLTIFLEIVRLCNQFYEDDQEAARRIIGVAEHVVRTVKNERTYYQIEDVLTPLVAKIITNADINSPLIDEAVAAARSLRSPQLVDAIFGRILAGKNNYGGALARLGGDRTLGGSVLARLNRETVKARLKGSPEWGQEPELRAAARLIIEGLQHIERTRSDWPPAIAAGIPKNN